MPVNAPSRYWGYNLCGEAHAIADLLWLIEVCYHVQFQIMEKSFDIMYWEWITPSGIHPEVSIARHTQLRQDTAIPRYHKAVRVVSIMTCEAIPASRLRIGRTFSMFLTSILHIYPISEPRYSSSLPNSSSSSPSSSSSSCPSPPSSSSEVLSPDPSLSPSLPGS